MTCHPMQLYAKRANHGMWRHERAHCKSCMVSNIAAGAEWLPAWFYSTHKSSLLKAHKRTSMHMHYNAHLLTACGTTLGRFTLMAHSSHSQWHSMGLTR